MSSNNDVDDVVLLQQIREPILTNVKIPIQLRKEFGAYLRLKYLNNEDAIDSSEQKELANIIKFGLIHSKKALFSKESSLQHREKKPRVDEWEKLGRIASEFLKIDSYPNIPSGALNAILNKALGNKDPRTIKSYKETVLQYCNKDKFRIINNLNLGQLEVSFFIQLIPKQYLDITATTSSLGETTQE